MKEKVYISGPVTGVDDYMNNFDAAEKIMRDQGFEVINPTTLPHNHGRTYREYMKEDLKALLECNYIYLISGWENSKGAVFELETADMCGILVL